MGDPAAAAQHNKEESNPTSEQLQNAVGAAQQAFGDTFGGAALQDATHDPNSSNGQDENSTNKTQGQVEEEHPE